MNVFIDSATRWFAIGQRRQCHQQKGDQIDLGEKKSEIVLVWKMLLMCGKIALVCKDLQRDVIQAKFQLVFEYWFG